MLCRRCYIKAKNIKKKDAKHLTSTAERYECSQCGEYKQLVIENRQWEEEPSWNNEFN